MLVPIFYLPAKSSSFFLAFFLPIYGEPFQETPYINTPSCEERGATAHAIGGIGERRA